mgnify:CR=1 FL=1
MALTEAQKRAQKKYNEANKDKRDRLRLRNATWRFIKHYATLEDIKEMENMLNERESLLKIIELKELIDGSRRGLPAITIWENKSEILKTLEATGDEDVNWVEYVADVYSDFEDDEKIIEVDLGNGLPEKFHAHEFEAIDEYTN